MQTTIYIRKENEELWNKYDDKSAFVNDAIKRDRLAIRESGTQLKDVEQVEAKTQPVKEIPHINYLKKK